MRNAIPGTSRKAITWCGPYALALVSGLSYDEVYKKMLRAKNKRQPKWRKLKHITRVSDQLMQIVAKTVKTPFYFKPAKRMTLSQYVDHLEPNTVYIIQITGHYVVIDTRTWELSDNQSLTWVPIKDSKHKRCFVKRLAEVKNHKIEVPDRLKITKERIMARRSM